MGLVDDDVNSYYKPAQGFKEKYKHNEERNGSYKEEANGILELEIQCQKWKKNNSLNWLNTRLDTAKE